MAQQGAPPPELINDAIGEILLRIPPDSSAYLARASMVCKLWRRIVSDPDFTRRYREFHRTPPLLGFLYNSEGLPLFFPTRAACPFPQPAVGYSHWWTLDFRRLWADDCRHGRVLLRHLDTGKIFVSDPFTGDREELPNPHIDHMFGSSMVICAVAGCNHCNCLGGPFHVVFVGSYAGWVHGCVYSSEARAWGTPVSVFMGRDWFVDLKRGVLVGDEAYFTLRSGVRILKYQLEKNCLSAIDPPDGYGWNVVIVPTDEGSLGFAGIKSSNLYLWSRKVDPNGLAGWVQYRVIELERLLPDNISCNRADVIGFAEGVNVMFVKIIATTFMIELKSGKVRKLTEFGHFSTVLPFMSFNTPGSTNSILPLSVDKN
ncbi:unnamed protein product [Urochloa decumbens]|uniref:F-box domain-containing protein n=1 Tax=Urochloa decumbens TaxID=240449 RepID=A0ABC9GUY8_9POAL